MEGTYCIDDFLEPDDTSTKINVAEKIKSYNPKPDNVEKNTWLTQLLICMRVRKN